MQNNVLCYLENSAEVYPNKYAVSDENKRFTYKQLNEICRCIGTSLSTYIKNGEPVGIYMEKDADAVCSFLGTVYAGGAYCMLNAELPNQRLIEIAEILSPKVIITCQRMHEKASEIFSNRYKIVDLEEIILNEPDNYRLLQRRKQAIDSDPLYINFTSGSTGKPKGIAVSHRSVIDFINCFTEIFKIIEKDVIANQAPFDFDVSVKDIYSALKTGAELVIIPRRMFSAPAELIDFLCDRNVTTLIWAVSALCLLTTFHALEYRTPKNISKIFFSGEVMPYKSLCNFKKYLPKALYVNLYGPTEITCNCTYHILSPERDYSEEIPIGIPFPNENVFLLDEDQLVSEPDRTGEICVRGTALALGYYRSPENNAKSFVNNPLNDYYPELIYRTGDLGKYNDRGELLFCGRKDFQIKYMGHRIELEEIERKMAAIPGIEQCCCVFDEERSRLKGFYTGSAEKEKILQEMKKELPIYMVPGTIRQIDEMPLTKNGKTDRKKLLESR